MRHRLAAILVADVAGYSRLMAGDERGTVAALDSARGVFKAQIESHQGHIIDMAGDSVLAVFETATGAVAAALAVQHVLTGQAAKVPEGRRMQFRIGIHLGDVIEKPDGTVYGDGVNIASRLQSLAEPGSVTVSDSVKSVVRGKVPAVFEDQGEQTVKNIPEPVHAYRVEAEGSTAAKPGSTVGEIDLSIPDKPSIAVLPFTNMSGDPEQEYFADGITEDIITDISRVSGLFVVARNSSFVFKNRAVDIKEVGRRLGVMHVLEGSVRKAGARVRITAQLIDAQTGGHLWVERFDRELADIFAVQDEVTRRIVDVLKVRLTTPERSRREQRGRVNAEAYDYAVRGRRSLRQYTPESAKESRALLERALAIDNRFAPAYANLALVHFGEFINGWNEAGEEHLERGLEFVNKALEADPNEALAYEALAMLKLCRREYEAAERAAERVIELDPNFGEGFLTLGQVLDFMGRHGDAIKAIERGLRLDPEFDLAVHLLGRAQLGMGRYAEAEQSFKRRLALNPHSDMTRAYLASLYGSLGRHEEARQVWDEMLAINPHFSTERLRRTLPYRDPVWFERIVDGLRKAGIAPRDAGDVGTAGISS
ncbi:MAG TPA: adenylate/guanylate cyclase domain-containing protein [Burkholderiales bacterium]|jgi:adenylate cyclase|nr:adenylate/guanylate cyclase domain-containing protein [Burkholderiales bacterium]